MADLSNGNLQTMITYFKRTASSHMTDRTSLTYSPALLRHLYDRLQSLMNILKIEFSWLCLLDIFVYANIIVCVFCLHLGCLSKYSLLCVFYNAVQNVYNVLYFKTSSMCIFNAVKNQSGIRFRTDILFGNFAYLHS